MKYNFNIILNGQMEANSEKELIEKISEIINRNSAFQQIEKVFNIRIDRNSIEGEGDESVFDKIAEDFNVEKKNALDFEVLTHKIGADLPEVTLRR